MRWLIGLVTAFVLLGVAVGDPREFARQRGGTRRISIATGGTGGVWYPYGGGLARVISSHVAGVNATAEATAGTNDNLKFVRAGSADLAIVMADGLDEAHRGVGPFATIGKVPARAIAVLYDNYTHVVARRGAGVRRVADLRGKTVSTGAPGSGTETIALRLLRAAGLDPDRDVRRQALSAAQSIDALRDGKIDALIWSGGVPTGAILDLASSRGTPVDFIASDDLVDAMNTAHGPLYRAAAIVRGSYPGLDRDVPVVVIPNLLVADAGMSDRLAYDVTRTMFERRDDLIAVHREARHLDPARAVLGSPVPFHPGAIAFYRERGTWRD
jgi:TRAP transporter TAXI family solute receptor